MERTIESPTFDALKTFLGIIVAVKVRGKEGVVEFPPIFA